MPIYNKEIGESSTKKYANLASSLGAKVIIPMDYDKGTLDAFLKELGKEKVKAIEKLTVKSRDLEGKTGEVIVLASATKSK